MEKDVLLQVNDVWVERPGAEVLRGVNLTVLRGEVHALLGLNGSGKTSLALTLMGAGGYEPCRGRVFFAGQDITGLGVTERARLGLTLAWQEPARFEGLLVADYLALGMEEPSRERVEEALTAVALAPFLQRRCWRSASSPPWSSGRSARDAPSSSSWLRSRSCSWSHEP